MTTGEGHISPQGHNLNKLDRGPLADSIYQISRLFARWFQKIISCFPYISQCKTCDPKAGPFLAPGHIFFKFGRGPLLINIPNFKALGLVVSEKKIFACFPYKSIKTCDPQVGPFFGPRGII